MQLSTKRFELVMLHLPELGPFGRDAELLQRASLTVAGRSLIPPALDLGPIDGLLHARGTVFQSLPIGAEVDVLIGVIDERRLGELLFPVRLLPRQVFDLIDRYRLCGLLANRRIVRLDIDR